MLTEIVRAGAQNILKAAIEEDVSNYVKDRIEIVDENSRRLVVRNGSLPQREILTGGGPGHRQSVSRPRQTISSRT